MRIAQVARLPEVCHRNFGGTERVVSRLTEHLVELGHSVTLFASGDSVTRGSLVPVWPRALRLDKPRVDPIVAQSVALQHIADRSAEFDIIHFHTDWMHLPLLSRLRVPFLTTLHGRLDVPGLIALVSGFPAAPFVSISESQRAPLLTANWADTVYHGMPPELLRPCCEQEGYLAFLGRLSPEKGADAAIRIARQAKMPLRIAAKLSRDEFRYFREQIEPRLDSQIRFLGESGDAEKQQFLGKAVALLFPIDWPEPFGLVMIEAMACGTPVIAFCRGSVPEIVEHGTSGFVVDGELEAVAAAATLKWLDRHQVRQSFDRRFTVRQMTENYLQTYNALLERTQRDLARIQSAARLRNRLDETTKPIGLVEKVIRGNPSQNSPEQVFAPLISPK